MTDVQNALVQWVKGRQGRYAYSQGPNRLNPDAAGYTDCSALMHEAYRVVAGIEIGTWTGNQQDHGTVVVGSDVQTAGEAEALMQPGDLVFFDWDGQAVQYFDHVEMYIGGGQICGHGGPMNGPVIKSLAEQWGMAHTVIARRYVDGDTQVQAPSVPAASGVPRINFPAFDIPGDQYFGLISGPNESHGGYFESEKDNVRAIQQWLIAHGYVPGIHDIGNGWADGIFEEPTAQAVARFQHAERPNGTEFWGQVWSDDYATMAANNG